jgi:ABC-type multidrug transport system fused ATPase/permease subunit
MSDDRDLVPRATAGRRIRFALALLKGLRPSLIAAIAAMTVVLAVAGAALSLAFRAMVDGAIDVSWAYATGAAVVAGLAAGAMSVGYRVNFNVQTLAASRLSAEVERRALRLSARMRGIEHLERPEYLDQIQLVSQGSQGLIWALLAVAELASVTASLAISVVLLFTVSPWLALIPVFAIPAVLLSPLAQRLSEQAMAAAAERSRASDSIHRLFSDRNAAMEMRIFGCGAALDERANQLWDEVGSVKFRGALHSAVVSTVGWVCLAIGYIGALAVVVDMVSSGAATPGDALLVTQLTLLIRTDIARSAASIRQSASAMRMIDRVVWLEDTAERDEREFAGTGTAPRPIRSGIAVENVSFRYPGTDVTVLDGIELDLPAGSSLAIVGRNGSGKTTLAKLLCRLYDPDEGSISVDGRDMRDLDPEDWRATIGGSFQDYLQLEEILRRSVGAGDPDLMDDESHRWHDDPPRAELPRRRAALGRSVAAAGHRPRDDADLAVDARPRRAHRGARSHRRAPAPRALLRGHRSRRRNETDRRHHHPSHVVGALRRPDRGARRGPCGGDGFARRPHRAPRPVLRHVPTSGGCLRGLIRGRCGAQAMA